LVAVDAGRDPDALRAKYPDKAQHIITRSVVRPVLLDRNGRDGTPLTPPLLTGRIEVIPSLVFVPPPYSRTLQGLRQRGDDRPTDVRAPGPRYGVTVSWGVRFEPWVEGVRLLPGTNAALTPPEQAR
jgi:hypothetical protein